MAGTVCSNCDDYGDCMDDSVCSVCYSSRNKDFLELTALVKEFLEKLAKIGIKTTARNTAVWVKPPVDEL